MFMFEEILGLEVVAVRACRIDRRIRRNLEPEIILFSDKKTFIELSDQDYYTYHDCATSAKHIEVRQDPERWNMIKGDLEYFPEANSDF